MVRDDSPAQAVKLCSGCALLLFRRSSAIRIPEYVELFRTVAFCVWVVANVFRNL